MNQKPLISSTRLGLNAYAKAQGRQPVRQSVSSASRGMQQPTSDRFGFSRSEQVAKELKISVLKSLQAQSNSGLVKIRDVSSALDALLKRS